ncbi:YbaN family protein [Rhizobium sp. S152]|uniref:YbaN family protein n=1 Tax=Rhizobium sp. S152 TaxID=3055038 RepID=UPI0025A99CF0|nr:YbaN family protein [Rhizobium sp. S152]MDM9625508.1 YbaN family protein [Rhizobium sp. S152]
MVESSRERSDEEQAVPRSRPARIFYLVLGILMLVLGFIGALLPVMPTTIFLILAAWCFGRSSPRLEAWLLDHPRFGPTLRAWRENGAVPPHIKLIAVLGMLTGYAIFFVAVAPSVWLALAVAAGMLACAGYVISRPDA